MRITINFVLVIVLSLPAAVFAQCNIEDLAGSYQTQYGNMRCQAKGDTLNCCYRNLQSCDQRLELQFSRKRDQVVGKWLYSNGSKGSAKFAVTSECAMGDGLWGARRPTSAWWVKADPKAKVATQPGPPKEASKRPPQEVSKRPSQEVSKRPSQEVSKRPSKPALRTETKDPRVARRQRANETAAVNLGANTSLSSVEGKYPRCPKLGREALSLEPLRGNDRREYSVPHLYGLYCSYLYTGKEPNSVLFTADEQTYYQFASGSLLEESEVKVITHKYDATTGYPLHGSPPENGPIYSVPTYMNMYARRLNASPTVLERMYEKVVYNSQAKNFSEALDCHRRDVLPHRSKGKEYLVDPDLLDFDGIPSDGKVYQLADILDIYHADTALYGQHWISPSIKGFRADDGYYYMGIDYRDTQQFHIYRIDVDRASELASTSNAGSYNELKAILLAAHPGLRLSANDSTNLPGAIRYLKEDAPSLADRAARLGAIHKSGGCAFIEKSRYEHGLPFYVTFDEQDVRSIQAENDRIRSKATALGEAIRTRGSGRGLYFVNTRKSECKLVHTAELFNNQPGISFRIGNVDLGSSLEYRTGRMVIADRPYIEHLENIPMIAYNQCVRTNTTVRAYLRPGSISSQLVIENESNNVFPVRNRESFCTEALVEFELTSSDVAPDWYTCSMTCLKPVPSGETPYLFVVSKERAERYGVACPG